MTSFFFFADIQTLDIVQLLISNTDVNQYEPMYVVAGLNIVWWICIVLPCLTYYIVIFFFNINF